MRIHACVWHFFFISTGSNSSRLEAARVKKKKYKQVMRAVIKMETEI